MTLTVDRLAAVRPALDAVRRLWWLCAAVSLVWHHRRSGRFTDFSFSNHGAISCVLPPD